MKLIWHIIKKDIVRDRWALLLWALLFVGQVVIGLVAGNYEGADGEWVTRLQQGSGGLLWLQIVMGYILVARLVQADALVGTNGFWPTRPISAARLLAAKALGVLLIFGVLPVLLLLPWWLSCALGWREIFWTAVETLSWQLLMIGPAFLVASLTDDLGRVLLWTLLLLIGLLSWFLLLHATFGAALDKPAGSIGPAVMFTRVWLSCALLVLGGVLIAVYQYLTRRFVRSVVGVIVCLGLIALVGQVCPWNWAAQIGQLPEPPLTPPAGLIEGLTLRANPARGTFGQAPENKQERVAKDAALRLRLRVDGLPADTMIAAEKAEQTWSWANGLKMSRRGFYEPTGSPATAVAVLRRNYSLPVPPEDPETVQWRKERREKWEAVLRRGPGVQWKSPAAAAEDQRTMRGYATLPNSFLAKMREESPAYVASVHCILFQPAILAELELKAGARGQGGARSFHVLNLTVGNVASPGKNDSAHPGIKLEEGCLVTLVTTTPSVAKFGLWFSVALAAEFRNWLFRGQSLAVNHRTGDISEDVMTGGNGIPPLLVAGVVVAWDTLSIRPSTVIRNGQPVISDPQWRDHTTLVMMADKEVARFTREVKTDKFELEPEAHD